MTENNNLLELYFHIPFCERKCHYCDFLSAPAHMKTQDAYMEALLREVEERSKFLGAYNICSIFIGGGTPSIISAEWIVYLLLSVKKWFRVTPDAEITIEVNPGTVDEEKLRLYFQAGVNRLSIGLQSALDEELLRIGRIHTFSQFRDTYSMARRVGFHNLNVDIMSALPGQSLQDYDKTLQSIMELDPRPEHISAYSLIIEEGTLFAEQHKAGNLLLPDEECEREMYDLTDKILKEWGYHRYEISNYALEGYECRHNCGYWRRIQYAGFGLGAASLIQNHRFHNSQDLGVYLENPPEAAQEIHELSREEQMEEFLFLGLRLNQGVSMREFYKYFTCPMEEIYGSVIQKHMEEGLLEITADTRLCLTEKGRDLSNYVMASFLLTC